MTRVAIVTDSASDLPHEEAAAAGITVVPLIVSFGAETFKAGVDLSADEFWRADDRARRAVPHDRRRRTRRLPAGLPRRRSTAGPTRSSPSMSRGPCPATIKAAEVARALMPDREIHIVDSTSASMGVGLLAQMGADLAAAGVSAAEIARILDLRKEDLASTSLSTRWSSSSAAAGSAGARAAIGTMLNVKPIITIKNGSWRRRNASGRARRRASEPLELLTQKPLERASPPPHRRGRPRRLPARVQAARSSTSRGPVDGRRAVGRAAPGPGLRRRRRALQVTDRAPALPTRAVGCR